MDRILLEPKRRLLFRTMLAFAFVLAIQTGFSGYLVFTALEGLLQSNIDHKMLRMAAIAANDPLVGQTLAIKPDDRDAERTVARLNSFFQGVAPLVDVRGVYLYRVQDNRLVYLAGAAKPAAGAAMPTPRVTTSDLAALVDGRTVTTEPYRVGGALVKAVYVPVRREGRLIGLMTIEDDAQDIELFTSLQRQLWYTALGSFFVVGLVSYLVASTIVRPVRHLVNAAEQLGQGQFGARFKITGNDELNFLGQTFNDMAEDIAARDEQIRRMNEAALADAHQLYQHVLRASSSAILTADDQDRLTSENPAAGQLLGAHGEEMRTMAERLSPHPNLFALWRDHETAPIQELVLRTYGEERIVEATIARLTDHRNEPIGRSLTLVDRTDVKRLERELAMRERLAALGELAAGIAHEIRNPLNGIELMLGLVQEDLTEKGVLDERFTRIHGEVTRLNFILNDFLLFARPRPLEKERASLAELADDALMLLAPAIEEKEIEVVKHYGADVPPVLVDAGAMRRALVNLIKNACEAMPPHGRLCLSIAGPGASGDGCRIEVRDSGSGIADEVRDRLFDPFVTTKDAGTGLGLAIVHKTIVNHGGSIACANHPDGGACFTIALPFTEAA
jgi:signal transduction histidine kinase